MIIQHSKVIKLFLKQRHLRVYSIYLYNILTPVIQCYQKGITYLGNPKVVCIAQYDRFLWSGHVFIDLVPLNI